MKLSRHSSEALKNTYQGMGTVIELYPKNPSIQRRYRPAKTSAKALQGDWQKVGDQLWQVLEPKKSKF